MRTVISVLVAIAFASPVFAADTFRAGMSCGASTVSGQLTINTRGTLSVSITDPGLPTGTYSCALFCNGSGSPIKYTNECGTLSTAGRPFRTTVVGFLGTDDVFCWAPVVGVFHFAPDSYTCSSSFTLDVRR